MNISFVKVQSCKKGVEHIKTAALKLAFREIIENLTIQQERNRSPSIIQTQSINKQLETSIQVNENFDSEPKKNKQLTFLQSKVRQSTTPQQEIIQNEDLICEEQDSEIVQQEQDIKVKKKQSRVNFNTFEMKESQKVTYNGQIEHQDVKFGDVFVIKASVENSRQQQAATTSTFIEAVHELIVIGNSNYLGSINCVNMSNQFINNPIASQQKCFFTIVNPRTVSELQDDISYVCYGQRVQLQHKKSGQSLQMNLEVPSEERGSFQVLLSSQTNAQSILRIMPVSSCKKIGDRIQYNEQVIFQQDAQREYYLKLEKEESRYGTSKFIDINAADQPDCFHFHRVTNHENNVVQIIHQESQNMISVSEKQLNQYIMNKTCIINNLDAGEEQSQESFSLRQFDFNKYMMQDYEVVLNKNPQQFNSYGLFEIQPVNPFSDSPQNACRLKSYFTQQYLSVDPTDEKRIQLTYNIQSDHTIFYLMQDNSNSASIMNQFNQFLQLNPNGKLQFSFVSEDQAPQLFSIKRIESKVCQFLEEMNEIHNRLLNFHIYLQSWSLASDKRKQNEEILTFDYMKALQQRSQLMQEVQHLEDQLQSFSASISPTPCSLSFSENQDSEVKLVDKQTIVREQKLIELMFMILRIMDNMIYTSRQLIRDKDKSRLFKSHRSLPPTNSPSYVAFKCLNQLPLQIFCILLICIKGNSQNKRIVLDNDEFLCHQLRSYGPQVASLLKESIQECSDLTDWVKLIEPLDESANNIYDMTTFIKIISIGLVDSNNMGISRHQNKVCKELFSQGKNGKTKFLCQFNILADKATFNLYREEALHEYILKNTALNALHVIRTTEINEELFDIEELCEKSTQKKSLIQYVSFLTASINLMAQLCRGRNKKCMKKVQFLGVTAQHIFNIMKSSSISLQMKNSYIKLYEVLYIDIDPFMPLYYQTNFIWNQQYNKEFKLAQIFNHYVEPVEIGKLTKEFEDKMLPVIHELLSQGCNISEGLLKFKKKKFNNFRLNSIHKSSMILDNELKNKATSKIKFLITLYHLIYRVIYLGYINADQICQIIQPMLQIFIPFLSIKERSTLSMNENWLSDLMQESLKSLNQSGLMDKIDELFSITGLCLQQYFHSQVNLQINEFLLHFQRSYKNNCIQSLTTLKEEITSIFELLTIQRKNDHVQSNLLGFYFSNWPTNTPGFTQCKQALLMGTQQQWMEHLRKVEIIYETEIELYMQITGNSLVGQIFSPIRLEIQIQALEEESQKKDGKQKDEKTQEIDNQLNKLNNRIREIQYDYYKLRKTQNILRNLQVHKLILRLLKIQMSVSKESTSTVEISIKFLCLFCLDNPVNTGEIKNYIIDILNLANHNLRVSKLLGIFQQNLIKEHVLDLKLLLKNIFQTIQENKHTQQQLYGTLQSILTSKNTQISIKREILSNLFKISNFFNDVQYYKTFLEIKNKKEEQQYYNDFKQFQATISLVSQVIQDYPIGIQQIQAILVNEQINSILFNPGTSFLLKTELLKLIYSTQIQNVTTYSHFDMKELLTLLLNDLLLFPKYLEGIVPQLQDDEDLITVQKFKVKVFSDGDDKKKNLMATTPGPNVQQNAAQQQITQMNEQKRIVNDNTEYWQYLFNTSQWKGYQSGLVKLLYLLFAEISSRKWNIQEVNTTNQQIIMSEQLNQTNDESLFEVLALLKMNIDTLRNLLTTLKLKGMKNKIYISQLIYNLSKCLMICPIQQKLTQFKSSSKFTSEYRNTSIIRQQVHDYISKAKSSDDIMNLFYEKLRVYMLNNHFTLNRMMNTIKGDMQFQQQLLDEDMQFVVEGADRLTKDQFCKLFQNLYDEHHLHLNQCLYKNEQICITYEDASNYYDSYQSQKQQKNLDINKFYNKFVNYLESKKQTYDKQQLKKEQQSNPFQRNEEEESLFIKNTYTKFIYQYDLLINPQNPYNFYRLNNSLIETLTQQFLIRLMNSEDCYHIFSKILREEQLQDSTLAIQILYQLVNSTKNLQQTDKLFHFFLKQVPTLILFLNKDSSEFQQNDFSRIDIVLQCFIRLQSIDNEQFSKYFLMQDITLYTKFVSVIFNQTDRLISLDQQFKQFKYEYVENQWFYSKNEMQKEKNIILEKLLKTIQYTLITLSNLYLNIEIQKQMDQSMLQEILYFTTNYYQYINRCQLTHICTECDILIIYTYCIKTLNSFSQASPQNTQIIFNYKQLIPLLQYIITTNKYDLLADNLQDNYYRKLFKITLQFLLQIKLEVHPNMSEITYQILFEKMVKIYEFQSKRIDTLIKGQKCTHKDVNCTYLRCHYNFISFGEQELFTICFDILVLFNILSEHVDQIKTDKKIDYWQTLRNYPHKIYKDLSSNQKRNLNFIRIYSSLKQFVLEQAFDKQRKDTLQDYLTSNENIITAIEMVDSRQSQKVNMKKRATIGNRTYLFQQNNNNNNKHNANNDFSPRMKFKESIYKITNKKQLVQQTLDEAIPFKKLDEIVENQEDSTIRQSKAGKFNDVFINWYEGAQTSNIMDEKKQQFCMKMATSIHFFAKYVGQVEIVLQSISQEQYQLFYFVLPFHASQLLKQAKSQAKQIGSSQKQQKQKKLSLMADYYTEELAYRQKLSQYPIMNFITRKMYYLNYFNYILILIINSMHLGTLERNENDLNQQYPIVILVLNIILVISSFIILISEIINSQPYLTFKLNYNRRQIATNYNLGLEFNENQQSKKRLLNKRKLKLQQVLNQNKVFVQLFNFNFLYYLLFLIIAVISLFLNPFISLLLFDIIQLSKSLKKTLKLLTINILSIVQFIFLGIIFIYCYSFLAFAVFDNIEESLFINLFLRYINTGFRLQEILDESQIQNEWALELYSFTFFILIFVISISIILGLISGIFWNETYNRINPKRKCIICNLTYEKCIELNMNWIEHTRKKHNLDNYLFFISTLKERNKKQVNELRSELVAFIIKYMNFNKEIEQFPLLNISYKVVDNDNKLYPADMRQYLLLEAATNDQKLIKGSLVYNAAVSMPSFYFLIQDLENGKYISLDEYLKSEEELKNFIKDLHPITGIPEYTLHNCMLKEFIQFVNRDSDGYLLSLISYYLSKLMFYVKVNQQ